MNHQTIRSLSRKFLLAAFLAPFLVNCSGGSSSAPASGQSSQVEPPPGTTPPPPGTQPGTPPVDQPPAAASIVALENARQGTSAWQLVNPALNNEIEGYASLTSVNRGGDIDFFINTSAPSYNVEIYRMGYYGGAGARLMRSFTGIARQAQPLPCLNQDNVIECDWNASLRLRIPDAESDPRAEAYWPSGIYLARLITNTTPVKDSYIIFVVRDDARAATYVQQLPVSTYQAYNFWGGKSLYTGCASHSNGWDCGPGQPPASAVSFNRPYGRGATAASAPGVGAGEFLTNVQPVHAGYNISNAGWDYNMLRWVEKQGYDVKYISNLDLHENSEVLSQAKAFISVGHDEYYSKAMWDRLVAARAAGINLAFFSANQLFWQVRFTPGRYGENKANRIMICYRGGGDPVTDNNQTTDQFRFLGRPEASLIGNQYVTDPVVGDITITNAGHWLFAQSGATNGALLKGLLGYEVNSHVEGISPAQTKKLASSPFTFKSASMTSDVTFYVDASSAQVFSTGSMQWSWGLDNYIPGNVRPDYTSAVAQASTANLFAAIGEKNLSTLRHPDSGLALAIPAGDLAGAPVVVSGPVSGTSSGNARAQQWRLVASGDGSYYHVVSRGNGLCLQALGSNGGAQVATSDCNGSDRQKWRLDAIDAGKLSLTEKSTGLCLQSTGAAGGGLSIDACGNKANQQWQQAPI